MFLFKFILSVHGGSCATRTGLRSVVLSTLEKMEAVHVWRYAVVMRRENRLDQQIVELSTLGDIANPVTRHKSFELVFIANIYRTSSGLY